MRKRFWTIRKNKYKNKTRKQKKIRHKKNKTKKMKGGATPFSEITGLPSVVSSFTNPLSTYIPASGNVVSSPFTWNQFTQIPGSKS
jgi:hypothetical protein